ncbi:MAG: hypothetical protein QUS12_10430, partial [Methanosarcina sp.]|nr:hypothetical protein [Methanosarcina sp.]
IICREGNGEFFFASKHIPKLWGESIPELKKKVDEEMKRKGLTEDSFKVEVTTKGDNGEYVSNALRFATQNEAEQYAKDLAWKWTAVLDYRVTSSSDPVNSKWESGHVISVDSKKSTAKDTATKEIKVIDQIAELEKQKEQAKKMGYGTDAYDIAIEGLRKQKDVLTQDPLTEKGEKILETMKEQYGEEEGERVFHASKNAGKIKGVD